jgi:uncharacterized RDD family membrane protein YckC
VSTTGIERGTGRTEQISVPAAYASWARRAAAGLIDGLPALLAAALLVPGYTTALLAAGRTRSLGPDWAAGTGWLTAGLVALLVSVVWTALDRWWWQGRTGRSLGKRALGLTLLGDWTRAPVGMSHVALRDLVHALDALTVIGYLWPLWDPRRQTLADKLTRTVVTSARRPG